MAEWFNEEQSHPLRMRGLKQRRMSLKQISSLSHPLRMRGLKRHGRDQPFDNTQSHPLRMRGLKRHKRDTGDYALCRILYGCVD